MLQIRGQSPRAIETGRLFPIQDLIRPTSCGRIRTALSKITLQHYIRPSDILPLDEKDRFIRSESRRLLRRLRAGARQFDVALDTECQTSFSIATLIYNIEDKDLLSPSAPDMAEAIMTIGTEDLAAPCSPTSSRYCFLEAIIRRGYLRVERHERSIKPLQSIPSAQEVSALVSLWEDVPVNRITSASRASDIIRARFRLAYVLRNVCLLSLTQIGNILGGRDHTTILNSINQVRISISKDRAMALRMFAMCDIADQIGADRAYQFCRTAAHRL